MRTIAVIGATGKQGGSVVRALSKNGSFRVKALCRLMNSGKAKAIGKLPNVELFHADLDNIETLMQAFKDCWGVFAYTDFFQDPDRMVIQEQVQGKNIIDAAVRNNVYFVVYSSLPNAAVVSNNTLNVPHFTNKALVESYASSLTDINTKFGFIYPGMFLQSITYGFYPFRLSSDGVLENTAIPLHYDVPLPVLDVNDLGELVLEMFNKDKDWAGKRLAAVSEFITIPDLLYIVAEHDNLEWRYNDCTYEEFLSKSSIYMTDMWKYFNTYGYYGRYFTFDDLNYAKLKLNPSLKLAKDWIKEVGTEWLKEVKPWIGNNAKGELSQRDSL